MAISRHGAWSLNNLFLCNTADVIQALFQALDARTKAMAGVRTREGGGAGGGSMNSSVLQKSSNKDNQYSSATSRQSSALSAIFMLNNIAYVRRELLMNSNVPDLLASGNNGISSSNRRDSTSTSATGPGGGGSGIGGDAGIEDELNKRNRLAKSNYLEIFSPLVSCLMDAGTEQSMLNLKNAIGVGGNSEKKDTKDRFIRFNESLDEIENIHKVSRLDKNESDLRERVKDEVVRMCVPTYTAFVKRHDGFSKSECIKKRRQYKRYRSNTLTDTLYFSLFLCLIQTHQNIFELIQLALKLD